MYCMLSHDQYFDVSDLIIMRYVHTHIAPPIIFRHIIMRTTSSSTMYVAIYLHHTPLGKMLFINLASIIMYIGII